MINKIDKFPFFKQNYFKLSYQSTLSSLLDFFKVLCFSLILNPLTYGMFIFDFRKSLSSSFDFTNKFSFKINRNHKWSEKILFSNSMKYKNIINKNKINANRLLSLIDNNNVTIKHVSGNAHPNYFFFPILSNYRKEISKNLLKIGIESGFHFSNSIKWASEFGYKYGDCPNTEQIVQKIVTIPIHQKINNHKLNKIVEILNKNYGI